MDAAKISIIVGIVVGVFAIIGGLYKFFTTTQIGQQSWIVLAEALSAFGSFCWRNRKLVALLIIVIIAAGIAYYFLHTKTISGTVYQYPQPCEQNRGYDPAPNVTVFVSTRRELKSAPTGADGKFSIVVPARLAVDSLTMETGGQAYPTTFNAAGNYPVIPRPCPIPLDIRECENDWTELDASQCAGDDGQGMPNMKRFVGNCSLAAGTNRKEAFLTLERLGNVKIVNAFVTQPTIQSQLYRNAMIPASANRSASQARNLCGRGKPICRDI